MKKVTATNGTQGIPKDPSVARRLIKSDEWRRICGLDTAERSPAVIKRIGRVPSLFGEAGGLLKPLRRRLLQGAGAASGRAEPVACTDSLGKHGLQIGKICCNPGRHARGISKPIHPGKQRLLRALTNKAGVGSGLDRDPVTLDRFGDFQLGFGLEQKRPRL